MLRAAVRLTAITSDEAGILNPNSVLFSFVQEVFLSASTTYTASPRHFVFRCSVSERVCWLYNTSPDSDRSQVLAKVDRRPGNS